MNKIRKMLKDIFFPPNFTCDVCGVECFGSNICESCKKQLNLNNGEVCPLCGRRTMRPEICYECKEKPPVYKQAVSAFAYEGNAVALVSKFKNGKGYLKDFFADLLAEKIKIFPQTDCIVYVPITRKALKKRGYNQCRLLADSLSERTGIPVAHGALEKLKETDTQKALSRRERAENLKGCFRVARESLVFDKAVLLLDDIMTTGATIEECTKALYRAGAKNVYVATVASVEYKIIKQENASDIKKVKQPKSKK